MFPIAFSEVLDIGPKPKDENSKRKPLLFTNEKNETLHKMLFRDIEVKKKMRWKDRQGTRPSMIMMRKPNYK